MSDIYYFKTDRMGHKIWEELQEPEDGYFKRAGRICQPIRFPENTIYTVFHYNGKRQFEVCEHHMLNG